MTQFAICRIESTESLSPNIELEPVSDSFYEPVISQIFNENLRDTLFIPRYDKLDVDSLCTSAQVVLHSGEHFKSTKLFKLIDELKDNIVEIVMWYGNDFDDLEYFHDFREFLEELETSVSEPTCESYIHFVNKRANDAF